MSVDLKQQLELMDYFGVVAVWCIFFFVMFVISVTCLNFCCVTKYDDITVMEEWGYNHGMKMKLGPHRPSVVAANIRQPVTHDE